MDRPKLRRLERLRMRRGDEELVVLRDPLELFEPFAIDASYEAVLDALDGQRTLAQVRQSLLMRGLARVESEDLEDFVADIAELGLLDDETFRGLWAAAHDRFVEQEVRDARLAGLVYPDEPEALHEWLAAALPQVAARPLVNAPIAVVIPHQPPPAYAAALARLLARLPAPEHYDRVVVLATDHSPGLLPYAVCDKDFATPLGLVRADLESLATLEDRLPWLFREQIRLRSCDAVEWAALILRGLWGDRCPPVLAIACGQSRLTTQDGLVHAREFDAVVHELLAADTRESKVLWWTVAELSHVGPAYGHAELPSAEDLERDDRAMLEPLLEQRPQQLAASLMDRAVDRRPSGTAALVTLAEQLPAGYRTQLVDYTAVATTGPDPGWSGCPTLCFDFQGAGEPID